MGICQSIGGASTSGQGLTGRQVSGALAAAASAHIQRRQSHLNTLQETERAFVKHGDGDVIPMLEQLGKEKYSETQEFQFRVPNKKGKLEGVTVREYAPDVFWFMRQLEGFEDDVFLYEWTLPEEQLVLEPSEGRSMALFLKSRSMQFMCKTISKMEVDVFLSFLERYTEYIARNPNTFLMRFLMLIRVEAGGDEGFILCFSDVFAPCRVLHEKWDLKGRAPKPGKYQHFPELINVSSRSVKETPHMMTQKQRQQQQQQQGGKNVEGVAAATGRMVTRKDKDLRRLFLLERHQRERVLEVLMQDYEFLGTMRLMDYSLLIGVAYTEEKILQTRKCMHMMCPMDNGNLADIVEARRRSSQRCCAKSRDFAEGIKSVCGQEVYYIGIIDMFTRYTWKKKVANCCKSILWKDGTLSTVPPTAYRDRIVNYTKAIFSVAEEVSGVDNKS